MKDNIRIDCKVSAEIDEIGASGLWDLAGKLAITAGLAHNKINNIDNVVYADEYGQEDIYNILRSYEKE